MIRCSLGLLTFAVTVIFCASSPADAQNKSDKYSPSSSITETFFSVRTPTLYSYPLKTTLTSSHNDKQIFSNKINANWSVDTGLIAVSENIKAENNTFLLDVTGTIDGAKATPNQTSGHVYLSSQDVFTDFYVPRLEANPLFRLDIEIDVDIEIDAQINPPQDNRTRGRNDLSANLFVIGASGSNIWPPVTNPQDPAEKKNSFHYKYSIDITQTTGKYAGMGYHPDAAAMLWPTTVTLPGGKDLKCFKFSLNRIFSCLAERHNDRVLEQSLPGRKQLGWSLSPLVTLKASWSSEKFKPYAPASCLAKGRIKITVVDPKSPQSKAEAFSLKKATTVDGNSVTATYMVNGSRPTVAVPLKLYRSSTPVLGNSSSDKSPEFLGSTSILPNEIKLNQVGEAIFRGIELKPDPKKPFVVVVANEGTPKASQTYFRKWRVAAVVHGFAGVIPGDFASTFAWVRQLSNGLKKYKGYDEVIELDWRDDSIKDTPARLTLKWGEILSRRIREYALDREKSHSGDVIDALLIGHSRGTVVISEALKEFSKNPCIGANLDLVLLDCHPANNKSNEVLPRPLFSTSETDEGQYALSRTTAFQKAAGDNEIAIPKSVGVNSIKIYYQRSPVSSLSGFRDSKFNLFGLSKDDGRIANSSEIEIVWFDLTTKQVDGKAIGHDGVHDYYYRYEVTGPIETLLQPSRESNSARLEFPRNALQHSSKGQFSSLRLECPLSLVST